MANLAQLNTLSVIQISPNDAEGISRFIDIIAAAFSQSPLLVAFVCEIDGTPPPYPSNTLNMPRIRKHFEEGITSLAEDGAILVHAGDWSAIALWEPPNFKGRTFTDAKNKRGPLSVAWSGKVRSIKEKYLGVVEAECSTEHENRNSSQLPFKPFYHLGFLARNPDKPSVPGAITAVVLPYMEKARLERVPVWLESTSPYASSIYTHFGFRTVEDIVIGEGKVAADGWPEEGGPGATAFAMICDVSNS